MAFLPCCCAVLTRGLVRAQARRRGGLAVAVAVALDGGGLTVRHRLSHFDRQWQ